MPPSDDATLAVVVARLDDLREQQRADTKTLTESIEAVRQQLAAMRGEVVSRDTWETRNAHVDGRFQDQGREIGDLRTSHAKDIADLRADIASRRAPWWSVAAVVVAAAALAITLIQIIP